MQINEQICKRLVAFKCGIKLVAALRARFWPTPKPIPRSMRWTSITGPLMARREGRITQEQFRETMGIKS